MTAITRLTCLCGLLLACSTPATATGQSARPTQGAATEGTKHHQGITARDAMPESLHLRNVGGSDGSGLCVFASISHSARYQGIDELVDLMDWMRSREGGGWPEKVDRVFTAKLGPDHGIEYAHLFGPESLPVLERAIEAGLMPCVSYGYSERYGVFINHMVNLVHLDASRACILDNNFPGADRYEWMSRAEFEARFRAEAGRSGNHIEGSGWAIILFSGAPQPPEPESEP